MDQLLIASTLESTSTSEPSTPLPSSTPTPAPTPAPSPAPSVPAAPSRRELRHHEVIMLGVLFTLIAFAIFVFVLLWKYNRSKMRYIYYRMKYFICCCRLSDEDIRRQNEEDDTPLFDTLNDLLFGINENDEVGRVNISALTNDYEDGESAPLPLEVSVESFFPDLLAGLDSNINKTSQNDESNDNNLREALLNNDNRSRDEG